MNSSKKKLHKTLLVLGVIVLLVVLVWIAVNAILPPDQKAMEKCFQEDRSDLALAADYLSRIDYGYVVIDESGLDENVMFTGADTRYQNMNDPSFTAVLNRLLGWGGYNRITKSDGTIVFEKWGFGDMDRGIAYPITEGTRPNVEFLIKAEPLSENGWYYYEADYEQYRIQNQLW